MYLANNPTKEVVLWLLFYSQESEGKEWLDDFRWVAQCVQWSGEFRSNRVPSAHSFIQQTFILCSLCASGHWRCSDATGMRQKTFLLFWSVCSRGTMAVGGRIALLEESREGSSSSRILNTFSWKETNGLDVILDTLRLADLTVSEE